MEITYLGNSCIRLRGRETQVLIDPPDGHLPGFSKASPDLVVRTEGRTDPDLLRPAEGRSQQVSGPGEFEVRGVSVLGVDAGAGRTLVRVEIDEVAVVSVGRLDRQLTEDEVNSLGHVDVLVLPVGGGNSLAPQAATKVVSAVGPAVVVPVHYRHAASPGSGELDPVETFAREMGMAEDAVQSQPKLNLNGASGAADNSRVVILEPRGLS